MSTLNYTMSGNFHGMEGVFTYYFFLKISVHPKRLPDFHNLRKYYFGPSDKKVMSKLE